MHPEPGFQRELEAARETRGYVWVEKGSRCAMGFILGLSESLLLMQKFSDFADYGYIVIRRDVITDVVFQTRPLIFFERMMKAEGILDRVGLELDVPLVSMSAALHALQRARELVMFDRGVHDDEEVDCFVGEVLSADEATTEIRHVTAWGQWEERVRTLQTAHVERAEFGSPYLRAIARHSVRPVE